MFVLERTVFISLRTLLWSILSLLFGDTRLKGKCLSYIKIRMKYCLFIRIVSFHWCQPISHWRILFVCSHARLKPRIEESGMTTNVEVVSWPILCFQMVYFQKEYLSLRIVSHLQHGLRFSQFSIYFWNKQKERKKLRSTCVRQQKNFDENFWIFLLFIFLAYTATLVDFFSFFFLSICTLFSHRPVKWSSVMTSQWQLVTQVC